MKSQDLRRPDWDAVRDELGLRYECSYEDIARRLLQRLQRSPGSTPQERQIPSRPGPKLTIQDVREELERLIDYEIRQYGEASIHRMSAYEDVQEWIDQRVKGAPSSVIEDDAGRDAGNGYTVEEEDTLPQA